MFEPRDKVIRLTRKDLRFIGGTENFDLWWRLQQGENSVKAAEYRLRVHRIAGGTLNWDMFKLPLRHNTEVDIWAHPRDRGLAGYWGDVTLSWSDADTIETYLQCFAPWVREDTNNFAERNDA